MKVERIELHNETLANCWLLTDEGTNESALVDVGWFYDDLRDYIAQNNINVRYILLTHGHFDHMLGVNKCREFTGAKIAIHSGDKDALNSKEVNLYYDFGVDAPFYPCEGDIILNDGDEIQIGNSKLKVMHTPGHSRGSVCYIDEEGKNLLTGDTVFCSTVGRTDIAFGSPEDLKNSIIKILDLQGDYQIYPGHGPITNLDRERTRNIYIRRMNRH